MKYNSHELNSLNL